MFCNIINTCSNLTEKIEPSKLVCKILSSLVERFKMKVIAVKENKNVDTIKLDEFIGSIQTYELILDPPKKKIYILQEHQEGHAWQQSRHGRGKTSPANTKIKRFLKKRNQQGNQQSKGKLSCSKDQKTKELKPLSSEGKKPKSTTP